MTPADRTEHRPGPWLAVAALSAGAAFALWRGAVLLPAVLGADTPLPVRLILGTQWLVEAVFALGIAGTTALALAYLLLPRRDTGPSRLPTATAATAAPARVAILYLCCGDFDRRALDSLRRLRHDGPLELWIHDDLPGGDPCVDALLAEAGGATLLPVRVLRRPVKTGSKAGAINYVLRQIADRCDFVLLCDNDSVALDPHCLRQLLAPMCDPRTAVVQARNVPVFDDGMCTVNRVASRAIDVFHLFLEVGSRLAWMPFVGHNALLRVAAVLQVGGLRPGCFADDIDLTLRLQLAGSRVHYASNVRIGERHPPNYSAFRKRAYKWACGSTQVLRSWFVPALRSRQLTLAEKWGFLQFLGFFTLQTLALAYTAMTFLVAPFVLSRDWFTVAGTLIAGSALPLLIFLPVLAYALREPWWRDLPGFLAACWLCYGAADFPTARGTLHGLSRRMRRWVPTNSVRGGADRAMLAEALFGAAILLVPLWRFPELLLSPLTFLIAAKFLLLPTVGELYQDGQRVPARRTVLVSWLPRLLRITGVLALAGMLFGQATPRASSDVVVHGRQLLVGGQPYVVRGIHYGPWRPGTGPGHSPYPSAEEVAADLDLVAAAHANTVFVFDAPRYVLDLAAARGLRVLFGFWLDWEKFGSEPFAAAERAAVATVAELRDHPALLGWVLGNELPARLVARIGKGPMRAWLHGLYDTVKARDPGHPVTHANWPPLRALDLSFLDLCAFNVYALWPPEVVANGYGRFIADVLQPLAGDRPLLITEYGASSLEAGLDGQGRLAAQCWRELLGAGAVGGFAFEFADEWWKNYTNPVFELAYWDRELDPDDHLRHDADPEEHYGLLDGYRHPKPAYGVVAAMYGGASAPAVIPKATDWIPWLVGLALGAAVLAFVVARSARGRQADVTAAPAPE